MVKNTAKIILKFSIDKDGSFVPGLSKTVTFEQPGKYIIRHPDENIDLCLFAIGSVLKE